MLMAQHTQRIWLQRNSGDKMVTQADSCQQTEVIWCVCRELVIHIHQSQAINALNVSGASVLGKYV